jgi:hypothetical protein
LISLTFHHTATVYENHEKVIPSHVLEPGKLITVGSSNRNTICDINNVENGCRGALSLILLLNFVFSQPFEGTEKKKDLQITLQVLDSIGRGERIRTFDPYNPIVVRYQAAPRPDSDLVEYISARTRHVT